MDSTKIFQLIIAFFIPPLAVYMARGWGQECKLNLILTILIFIPGMLHAFWIVMKD
ncbi:Pmp3p SCDLUD_003172 [Saccharomycodes ludwigii]|uniref:Pmp3p n=1 Tax=Saccharomycodes ludwigii TaxID=36035 RepID=UPI001E8465D1|nr:hypothetical protein SCDLUD_003172 [Saccharomycodes ludwigii]KAH3900201.1 hypothetical protein SCDLUD_003172 [Saccharomycodes ludwigii]